MEHLYLTHANTCQTINEANTHTLTPSGPTHPHLWQHGLTFCVVLGSKDQAQMTPWPYVEKETTQTYMAPVASWPLETYKALCGILDTGCPGGSQWQHGP